jgi:uncharacterized membrane protein
LVQGCYPHGYSEVPPTHPGGNQGLGKGTAIMKTAQLFLIVVLILGILGMAVYLIMQSHPWWALLFVLMATGITVRSDKS